MKLALVILNWNGQSLLEKYLPSVVRFSPEATIYVADNASTDNSIAFVKQKFPSVKIIKNETNGGYAKGYNDALQKINADVYGLINSDIEVTENWLKPITESFAEHRNMAIAQPKILDLKDKALFEYAGAGGGFIDFFGYPYCRGRIFNTLEKDKGQYNDFSEIFWASGACLFIRAEVFHRLKGFDEDYFAHQEEIDLCWRAQNKGYKVNYIGQSTVYHLGGGTLKENSPRKTFLNFRNSLLSNIKNTPRKHLLSVIFTRLILDGIAGLKFTIELRPVHTIAILKAHLSFYKNLPKFLKKRKKLSSQKKHNRHFSIVWQYFILQRTTFKSLR
ncbi:glycosyltransferase family 2 protein [Tenacibaculum sp. SG-28]|uniref:glycosyltransferase family 2 protein n=1 Tax=Tenacibaculum sp. SG-28 TaxID=754426 RepID=UPI000CF48BC6|nr:glycosyltransferase family 2 protein [Tenacibaculum sp. SG-28]PQJ20762.1 dTDP-Rha--alpha-D-GlcNAc-pyrophosphate polyprenol alpha-3-L-rhamnosyltransferase [Tenacibaculum sp. SG-28]